MSVPENWEHYMGIRKYSLAWWLRTVVIIIVCILAMGAKKVDCGAGSASAGAIPSGQLGCHRLAVLWEDGGGSWANSSMMAAIAKAESDGNQFAYLADSNGTNDEGYWGINSANEGTYYPAGANRYDPLTNAKAAVSIYNSVGYTAWATYNNGHYHGFCGIP